MTQITGELLDQGGMEYNARNYGMDPTASDNTQALANAINDTSRPDGFPIVIPPGTYHFTSWTPLDLPRAVTLTSRTPGGVNLVGTGAGLFTTEYAVSLQNIGLEGWGRVLDVTNNPALDRLSLRSVVVRDCTELVRWIGPAGTLGLLEVLDCDVDGLSGFCIWIEANTTRTMVIGNRVRNAVRYLLRMLYGGDDMHIVRNRVTDFTSGSFTGSLGVARLFQVDADRLWIRDNYFSNIHLNPGAEGNVNVLYGDCNELWVQSNHHLDIIGGSTAIYQDKAAETGSRNHTFTSNVFVQSEASEGRQAACIHTHAETAVITGNEFYGIRGTAAYVGWTASRDVIYANNVHRGLRGIHAVRIYGAFSGVKVEGNLFDGLNNDQQQVDTTDHPRMLSFAESGASSFGSEVSIRNNLFRNARMEVADPPAVRGAAIWFQTAAASNSTSRYQIEGNVFENMPDGIHFRGTAPLVDTVAIVGNEFRADVTNPILFASGVAYKPTNLVVQRNRGFATENRGSAQIPAGSASVTVPHGLRAAPTVVVATPRTGEAVWVSARDATSLTLTRAAAATALDVDWMAETVI